MKRFIALMGLAFGLAALICAGLASAVGAYNVTFTVTDDTGQPIAGATVSFDGRRGTTDGDGRVTFDTERGTFTWAATDEGRDTERGSVEVDGDEDVRVSLGGRDDAPAVEDEGPAADGDNDSNALSLDGVECCCAVAILLGVLILIVVLRRMGVI